MPRFLAGVSRGPREPSYRRTKMGYFRNMIKPLSLASTGILVELLLVGAGWIHGPATPPGPQTMDEVHRVAELLGLYTRSDRHDGVVCGRLVVSERPVSCE